MSNPILFHEVPAEPFQPSLPLVASGNNNGIDVAEYVKTLYDGRWLIFLLVLVGMLAAGVYVLVRQPVYEANMLIHVEEQNVQEAKTTFGEMGSMFNFKTTSNAEIELVRSRLVVSRALDRLNQYVQVRPDYFPVVGEWVSATLHLQFIPAGFGGYAWDTERAKVASFAVPDALLNELFDLVSKGDGAFSLSDPKGRIAAVDGRVGIPVSISTAFGPIDLLVSELQAPTGVRFELKRQSRLTLIENVQKNMDVKELGKQSAVIRTTLKSSDAGWAQAVLNKIGEEYIAQNAARKTQEANKALAFLNKQLPDLKQQLEESENRYSLFRNRKGTVDLGEEAKSDLQQVVAAKARKADLEQKRNEALVRFTPNHPVLIGVDAQLREVNTEIRTLNAHIKSLPLLEQELLKLSRDLKINTELYTSLLNTARQLRLVTASATSNVRLVDMPMMPERPISAGLPKIFGIGILAGLLAGIGAAVLRKSVRRGVEDPLEIEQMVNLPVYASIPHSDTQKNLKARRGRLPLLAKDAPYDGAMESLRKFRAVMHYMASRNRNNISLILSPTAGNGKSFISANLAALLGMGNKRVLLIDADLRNGDLHRYFNVDQEEGLTEALSGTANIEKLIRRDVAPNVDLITSGTLPRESELLLTPALQSLLRLLAPRYDMVLINGAPLLEVSDSLALGVHAGAVYVVAKAGVSTIREIGETVRQLRQAGLTANGCLFNGAKTRSHYAYQYKYTYGKHWNVQYLSSNARGGNVALRARSG
jgi:tyrosine-protein kinase Etk/Wzc